MDIFDTLNFDRGIDTTNKVVSQIHFTAELIRELSRNADGVPFTADALLPGGNAVVRDTLVVECFGLNRLFITLEQLGHKATAEVLAKLLSEPLDYANTVVEKITEGQTSDSALRVAIDAVSARLFPKQAAPQDTPATPQAANVQ